MLPASPADVKVAKRERVRADRWDSLAWLRDNSVRQSGRWCMSALGRNVSIAVTGTGVSHLRGVRRCASVWACPACSPVIRERRAAEIDAIVGAALAAGDHVMFVTATVQHSHRDDLATLLDQLQKAWTLTFKPRSRSLRASGYVGMIRTVEVTHGANGWHPHVHALLVFSGCERLDAESTSLLIGTHYRDALASLGMYASARHGFDVRPVVSSGELSSYLAKIEGGWGAGLEIARGDLKSSGTKPFDLLRRAVAGDVCAADLWRTFERSTARRRCIVVSRSLSARYGVELVDDETAAEAEMDAPSVVLFTVQQKMWALLVKRRAVAALLASLERYARGDGDLPAEWLAVGTLSHLCQPPPLAA